MASMPFEFRGHCSSCHHEWEGLLFSSAIAGPLDCLRPETYSTYYCGRCCRGLLVSRELDRNSWQPWLADKSHAIRRCALLKQACEKISAILSSARTSYVPVQIDIGSVTCPTCREEMPPGSIDTVSLVCPHCGSHAGRCLEIHSHVILENDSA